MTKPGRKSNAELTVVTNLETAALRPPPDLPTHFAAAFREIVSTAGPRHFRRCDVPLIAQLASAQCIATHYAGLVGKESDAFKSWEAAVKLVNALSRSLRLTPQSRYCSREAERSTRVPDAATAPWEGYDMYEDRNK
jgi:hypothetical protein